MNFKLKSFLFAPFYPFSYSKLHLLFFISLFLLYCILGIKPLKPWGLGFLPSTQNIITKTHTWKCLTLQPFLLRMHPWKKIQNFCFTPSQSNLKYESENRPWVRGLNWVGLDSRALRFSSLCSAVSAAVLYRITWTSNTPFIQCNNYPSHLPCPLFPIYWLITSGIYIVHFDHFSPTSFFEL